MSDSAAVRITEVITVAVLAFLVTVVLAVAANDRHSDKMRVAQIEACSDVAETYQDLCIHKVTG